MISLWQLPSPHRFLSGAVEDLRSGKSVVISLPPRLPETPRDLGRAIRHQLSDDLIWEAFDAVAELTPAPVDQLFERFIQNGPPDQVRNALTLAQHDRFTSRLVELRGLSSTNWLAWKDFLVAYEPACRGRSILDRSVFLVIVEGSLGKNLPMEDACLAVHRWDNIVGTLDLMLYASATFADVRLNRWQKQLVINIAVRLALWDPEVCDRLRRLPIEAFVSPQEWLAEMASDLGWSGSEADDSDRLWEKGIVQCFEGIPQTHSAFLVITGDKQELKRRLWSAQVQTLFPLIELQRQRLINELGSYLAVPYTTAFGVIDDVRELEFGHIADQLYTSRVPDHLEIRRFALWLKRLRDRLAHFEPLSCDLLVESRFSSRLNDP